MDGESITLANSYSDSGDKKSYSNSSLASFHAATSMNNFAHNLNLVARGKVKNQISSADNKRTA